MCFLSHFFDEATPPLFGANVYYRGTVALGRTGLIPAAHVYEGGLHSTNGRAHACQPGPVAVPLGHVGLLGRS